MFLSSVEVKEEIDTAVNQIGNSNVVGVQDDVSNIADFDSRYPIRQRRRL